MDASREGPVPESSTGAYSAGRIFHVRLVLAGRSYLYLGLQYWNQVTGEADADKDCPERFLRCVGPNHQFPELESVKLCFIASRKQLLHRFPKIGFRFFERPVAGVLARKTPQVGTVGIGIDLGQEYAGRDPRSRLIGVLDRDDSLENGAMVDVRQMLELDGLRWQHRGVQHHVVVLDAGHVQSGVVRSGLDADIALSPPDRPEIFLGNPAANFGVAGRKLLRHFAVTRRSLVRFAVGVK